MRPLPIFWLVLSLGPSACDNRQAFHEPEPGLERMLEQPRLNPFGESAAFSDGRGMRTPPRGTLPNGWTTAANPIIDTGREDGQYAAKIPISMTRALVADGHRRFEIQCAPCHGVLGDGNSVVATKMSLRRPPSLHEDRIRAFPPGRLYEVIALGYGLMPSYAAALSVEQRWGVVAYVAALQLSQHAVYRDLPQRVQHELQESKP